jgi:hypothetical protein
MSVPVVLPVVVEVLVVDAGQLVPEHYHHHLSPLGLSISLKGWGRKSRSL